MNSSFICISVNKNSASSSEMHKYNPFYYASYNCTHNTHKSCYNAQTGPESTFFMVISNTDLPRGVCSLQKDLVCAGHTWGGGLGRGEGEQLMSSGVNLSPFLEPCKALQAKRYLISADNALSGNMKLFVPSSLNQKERESS